MSQCQGAPAPTAAAARTTPRTTLPRTQAGYPKPAKEIKTSHASYLGSVSAKQTVANPLGWDCAELQFNRAHAQERQTQRQYLCLARQASWRGVKPEYQHPRLCS